MPLCEEGNYGGGAITSKPACSRIVGSILLKQIHFKPVTRVWACHGLKQKRQDPVDDVMFRLWKVDPAANIISFPKLLTEFGVGMMESHKRGRNEAAPSHSNGSFKKNKQEFDSGVGSKTKPCTKFFSIAGCPFGESCHFLHYVPGGYNAVAQVMNVAPPQVSRKFAGPPYHSNGSSTPTAKTHLCNKFISAEGCKYGDKCNFAHGERELGKPASQSYGRVGNWMEPGHAPNQAPASSFGASSTTKISVDATLAGPIIGKGGVNSKHICHKTGVKLAIRDHESDPNLRNIELEGTFEQVQLASALVRELIQSVLMAGPSKAPGRGAPGAPAPAPAPGSNFKTKLCGNFAKGTCTFGERCHFAHGAADVRKPGM